MRPTLLSLWAYALALVFCLSVTPQAAAVASPSNTPSWFRPLCATGDDDFWGENGTGWVIKFTNNTPRPLYLWAGALSNMNITDGTRTNPGASTQLKGAAGPDDIDFRITEHERGLTPGPVIDVDVRTQCTNFFGAFKVRLSCRVPASVYKCMIRQGVTGSETANREPIDITISQA